MKPYILATLVHITSYGLQKYLFCQCPVNLINDFLAWGKVLLIYQYQTPTFPLR